MEKLKSDYELDGAKYYSPLPPQYKTTLSIGIDDAQGLIPLDVMYSAFDKAYSNDSKKAFQFAKTYGKLRIGTALKLGPTVAEIKGVDQFDNNFAELETSTALYLSDVFSYPGIDSPLTYLLAKDESLTELQIIKAMHMIDAAIVTGQYVEGRLPVVAVTDLETLFKLRADNDGLMLRTYGNVRGLDDAPTTLGLVLPTSMLESACVSIAQLPKPNTKPSPIAKPVYVQPAGSKQAIIGITSAKKPHIGHAFLLAKAFSVSDNVVVELNDSGPRVAGAIQRIAGSRGITFAQAEFLVAKGEVTVEEIETAYKNRDTESTPPQLRTDFSLNRLNEYYRNLLLDIEPTAQNISTQSDSAISRDLQDLPGYTELYDGSVAVLSGSEYSMLAKSAGVLTVRGLFASFVKSLSEPTLVDSPPLFSKIELTILSHNGVDLDTAVGSGLKIDFAETSGTKGNSLPIEECIKILRSAGLSGEYLIAVIRRIMAKTVLVRPENGSLCPNFANLQTVSQRLLEESAILCDEFNCSDVKTVQESCNDLIKSPIDVIPASRAFSCSVIGAMGFDTSKAPGKLTCDHVRTLINYLPVIVDEFTDKLKDYLSRYPDEVTSIRKDLLTDYERNMMLGVIGGNPEQLLLLLTKQMEYDIAQDTDYATAVLKGTRLAETMVYMGYELTDIGALKQLLAKQQGKDNKGVFICQ